MNLETLLKKTVSIPSYLDNKTNEKKFANFLVNYIIQNLPWLKVKKQQVEKERYNVIARSDENPKLLFVSHMDTVLPIGNSKLRLTPEKKDKKLYGLGTVDMKAGLVASLKAVEKAGKGYSVALLFDCGEEYYFKGINKFIKGVKNNKLGFKPGWKPKIVIFPEPSNLKISNGCRGLLEIQAKIKGKTCHAGRPENGVNAVESAVKIITQLKKEIIQNDIPELGKTTVNLAGLNGGLLQDSKIVVRPNAVPDIAEFVLDIRSANPNLNGNKVCSLLEKQADTLDTLIINFETKLDYPPYLISKKSKSVGLKKVEEILRNTIKKVEYCKDISKSGYGELALIGGKLGWDSINLGPGPSKKAHQIDEYVNLSTVEQCYKVYSNLILKFKKNEK